MASKGLQGTRGDGDQGSSREKVLGPGQGMEAVSNFNPQKLGY